MKNTEIDKLKKKLLDADQSFLKQGGNNSIIAPGNFPHEVSSIDQNLFDGDDNNENLNSSKV